MRNLKAQTKDVEVHYLTKKSFAGIVEHNPNVDKVFTIEKSIKEVLSKLKAEKYDMLIDLHNNLRTFMLKRRLGVKSHAFRKLNINKWLLVNLGWNTMPDVHVVDRYMDATASLGITNDGKGIDYFIPKEEQVELSVLPETHQKGYIAFAIGGQFEGKKLPVNKLTEICQKISHPVVLLGGPGDKEVANKICSESGSNIHNACGAFSLNQSASLVEQANLVITHDTGLMHIASAFKKKIISLWGCTSPVLGMYPYLPDPKSVIIEPDHLSKRPCSKLGNKCKHGDFECAKQVDEDRILQAVEELF